jgi:hypothetical protein
MKLIHIQQETCAECGARAVEQYQDRQHTNGQWNEARRFACGAKIEHNPNAAQTFMARVCPHAESEKRKVEARNMAKAKLQNSLIPNLDCDEQYKERLQYAIDHVFVK